MPKRQRSRAEQRGIEQGYRSGLEEDNAALLRANDIPAEYEKNTILYTPPLKLRRYRPDFVLPNGIVVETKGRFLSADRQKHRYIQAEHPDIELRFVFSRSKAPINPGSNTTNAMWCDRYGFQWADKLIPVEWMLEPVNEVWVAAIKQAGIKK